MKRPTFLEGLLPAFLTLLWMCCVSSSPLKEPNLCGQPSCEPGKKFNYAIGTKYTHKYSVDVTTLFRGTSENKSTLYTDALIHITFYTPCQGLLHISDVTLSSERPKYDRSTDEDIVTPQLPKADEFANALSSKSLRFSFQDGVITELCPDPSDPVWVLNFKRGILSAFHNTMVRFDIDSSNVETDVNGECLTSYELQGAQSTALVIHKEKEFLSCRNRYQYRAILQTDPYNFGSTFQTVPLVKSRHRCEFSIDRKMYQHIECEEVHTFQPLSQAENGSQAITRQKISFVSEFVTNISLPADPLPKRVNLLFDHNATPKPTSGELRASRDLIKALCRLDTDNVHVGYPDAFTRLIHVGRRLSYAALVQIYNRAASLCSSGRKHITDVLPYLGSNAAVSVMVENMGKVPLNTAQEWLVAISFIPSPDEETLSTFVKLLNHSEPQVLLSMSALAHSYCKFQSECLSKDPVQKIVGFLNEKLRMCNETVLTPEQRDQILITLKAIGNLGLSDTDMSSMLKTCVLAEERDMELRTAAVTAHRRLSCLDSRDFFLDVYRNSSIDTEIRIASYLQVMKCPNYHTISLIRQQLDGEEVNQVGSFVWSHLQNQLSSAMPTKVLLQTLLTDRIINDKFNKDRRKFSRSYETSMFFDEFNAGGNLEGHVIFSPKSYFPRTVMTNFTLDLFGESVNVIEVEARAEGMEHLVEAVFGPGGPVSASKVNSHVDRAYRFFRSASEGIKIAQELNAIPNVIDNNFKSPKLSLGYKVFGNEIFYSSVTGHKEFSQLMEKVNPFSRLKQILSGEEITVNKASMFLEGDYIVPTGVGLPVTLSIQGTSAVHLNLAGNVRDLKALSLDIEGKLKPSVALEITGEMGVDAFYAATGIKLKGSIYTATAVEGHVKVEGKTKATVSFNLPKEKGEVIIAETKLIVMKGENEEEQAGITERRVSVNACSWPSLDHTLGLKGCVETAFPNATKYSADPKPLLKLLGSPEGNLTDLSPSFLLSGPSLLAVTIHKADPTAERYVLQYNWDQKENTTAVSFVFDTPGSKQLRELSAKLFLDNNSKNLTLLLQGVDNKFEAHGKYKYTPMEKYLDFSLDINGKKHMVAQVGLRTKPIKHGFLYQPKLYLSISSERIAELSGTVKITEKKEITLCEVNIDFRTKKLSLKVSGFMSKGQASWSTNMTFNYHFAGSDPQRLMVELRVGNTSSKSLTQYNGDLTVESTAYSYLNFESSIKYQRAQGHAECKLVVNTKPELKDDRHKFTAHVGFSVHKSYDRSSLNAFIEITKPISNIDLRLAINFNGQDEKSTTYLSLRYATGKEVTAALVLSIPRTELLKFDGKLNVTLPGFVPMVIILKLDEKKTSEYDIDLDAIWFSGHNLTTSGVYTDKSEGLLKSHSLKLFIQSPSFEDVAIIGRFVSDEHQFKLEAQAEHMNDKYALALKHSLYAPGEMEAYAEIRYKVSLYSVTTVVNLMKPRQIVMEIHLDKYRDVHIALSGINQVRLKEGGLEVKWDANRDPGQRFASKIRFQHPQALSYSADITASYPGREIIGSALFAVLGTKFDSGLHFEWSQADVIDVRVGAVYKSGNATDLKVNSQLLTPFSGWKRTSLSGGYHNEMNLVQTNGSVWWQDDQMVGVNLYWDYNLPDLNDTSVILTEEIPDDDEIPFKKLLYVYFPDFWCAFNASLLSTVAEVKPVHAALSHRQEQNILDTFIHYQGKTQLPVIIKSCWHLEDLRNATKIGGNVTINSPYRGYNRGFLVGHLYYTTDLDVDGTVDLNFDRKEYFGTIKGHVKSLRDSMLIVNFTTPIPQFSAIIGRVGYSEANRHLVCMWTMPASSLGVEIKFAFEDSKEFDLLLHFSTPLDFISKILLVGKREEDSIDARFGFNELLLGATGFWRYDGITDFDYKYSVFTPLGGFEETAVVAKIIVQNGLDIDLRIRVAGVKVGATLLWVRKTSGYKRVLLKMTAASEELEDEPEVALRWRGACIIDTYVYPTITCDLDLDEIGATIVVESNLLLPQGNVYLYDEFFFGDMFTVKNDLQLLTPFNACPELTSVANWYLVVMDEMLMEFEVHVRAQNITQKGGLLLRFKRDGPDEDEENEDLDEIKEVLPYNYVASLQFHTPWEALRLMRMTSSIELHDTNSKCNLTILTDETWFSVQATSVVDKEYIKVGLKTLMTSPTYTIPEIIIEAKRDVTDYETVFELSARCPFVNASYAVSGLYGFVPEKHLKLSCIIETTLDELELLKLTFSAYNETNVLKVSGKLQHKPELTIEINGIKNGTTLNFYAEKHRSVSIAFDGFITDAGTDKKNIQGNLVRTDVGKNKVEYKVDTELISTLQQPINLQVKLEPETEGARSVFVVVTSTRDLTVSASNVTLTYGHGSVSVQTALEITESGFASAGANIQSTLPSLRGINGEANIKRDIKEEWSLTLRGSSEIEKLKHLKFNGNYLFNSLKGKVGAALMTDDVSGEIQCSYSWLKAENMAGFLSGYYKLANGTDHSAQTELFFKHPNKNFKFISTGLNFDLDQIYRFGTNATLSLPSVEDVAFDLHLKLPLPGDVHSVVGKVRHTAGYSYVAHALQYSSQKGQSVAASSGEVSLNKTEVLGNVKVEWGVRPQLQTVTNVILYKKPNTSHVDVQYMLHTPYHQEDTVVARLNGNCPESVWDIKGQLFSPRNNQLTSVVLSYLALDNVNGTVTSKTPFARLPHAGAQFQVVSDSVGHYRRYLTVDWPNNTAVVKSDHSDIYTVVEGRKRDVSGQLLVEIPLATRHVTDVTYNYQDAYPKSSGECIVNYNKGKLLNGQYSCLSEAKAGHSKDDIDITVQNDYFPLGTHYIHEVDYDGSVDDAGTLLSKDRKWADVFKLNNRTAFNIAGELLVKSLETGKEIKLSAVQANSTVDLETDYHFLDHKFTHRSRLQLAPTVWVSYYLDIVNKTTEKQDEGNARLDIAYPNRNFTLTGNLRQNSLSHESQLRLDWDRPDSPKTVGAGFDWYRASRKPDQQVATLRIKHPSFVKDVTFNGTYIRHGRKSLVTRLEVEYCELPEKKLLVETIAQDLSSTNQTLYQLDIIALHPATRLDLNARGAVSIKSAEYQIRGDARYKRSFLGQQNGHLLAKVDGNQREIDFQKRLQHEESYLKARFYNDEPCCTRLNGSLAKTQVLNYTGDFFVDLEEKFLLFVVNMTPDGRDNFKAHGYVPDSRNAELNVWRTYDDLAVTDVACYLRLNHSRLVTSRLKWRPTLRKDILHGLEDIYLAALKNLDETVDYWKEYIRSEVKESISDVYYNSKPYVQQYIDDLEDLKSLEEDFEQLRTFLNESYNKNDFYVKDVAGTILLLVDELALKKHIEHLPAILGEIWQALGDSGEAMRQSIIWIIETIKSSYRKAVELLHQILHGDSTAKLSSLFEEWMSRYDRMVKELQMTVLRHIEQLYNSINESLSEAWGNLLRSIEPTYIQIIHYLEKVAWSVSHEVLDFLYERQTELQESPFFLQVANFTQDLDRFQKDLTNRDLFTNIQDYSTRFYNLLKERYLPKIPFGKEIQQVVNEIIEGFQELEKLPSINYFVKKKDEVMERVVWFWKSLDLGPKIQRVVTIVHRRVMDMTANALQSENRYREAKTKFVFEPVQGLVLLEQKLPMSWHAFNETPRFEEIPEYRALAVLQSQLAFTNKTFWSFYYEYKPYTEIQNWLPPFKAQAIIAGSQHLLTVDGRILTFRGDCDYLLARDFVNDNFSLVMRHDETTKDDQFLLSLITPQYSITIDIFNDDVRLPHGKSLPAQIDNLHIYKEHGVVTVEEKDGYLLQCNLLFQVCTLSLSGWYYGKTAGLLGTMDHEPTTDFLTSQGFVTNDIESFARSWTLNPGKCANFSNQAVIPSEPTKEVLQDCVSLFQAKSSHFSSCYGRVDPVPFLKMCLVSKRERCSAAAAYVQACLTQYTLLSIPDSCVQCMTVDGKSYGEGSFIQLHNDKVPRSVDIVFIIEAKTCNEEMTSNRNMDLLLNILAKELDEVGLKDNRYATVVFGGDGVYDKPRTLMADHSSNKQDVFTSRQNTLRLFQKFTVGNGTEDIFEAIAFASTLQFRPGVSKLFIVLPCSSCDPSNMIMEYSVLRQVLLESNARLHLIINNNFGFEKQRLAKIFYGMDSKYAYTKKDFKDLKGDEALRNQAKLPKSMMAYCAPLALETNGTVFAAKWLVGEKKNPVKKFISVVGKRIAASAEPASCQNCECSSFDTGMGYMDCQPCDFPSPVDINLGPSDNDDDAAEDFYDDDVDADEDNDNTSSGSAEGSQS